MIVNRADYAIIWCINGYFLTYWVTSSSFWSLVVGITIIFLAYSRWDRIHEEQQMQKDWQREVRKDDFPPEGGQR